MNDPRHHNWAGRGFWTDAKIARLTELVGLGWSFSQIGSDIGTTRNAALAKSHRLGLKQPANAWQPGRGRRGGATFTKPIAPKQPRPPHVNLDAQAPEGGLKAPSVNRDRHNGGMHMKAHKLKPELAVAGNGAVFERAPDGPEQILERIEAAGLATSLTLGRCMCKWPIGDPRDPTFTFCGRKTGETYCESHKARAYQAPKPRSPKTGNDLMRSLRRFVA